MVRILNHANPPRNPLNERNLRTAPPLHQHRKNLHLLARPLRLVSQGPTRQTDDHRTVDRNLPHPLGNQRHVRLHAKPGVQRPALFLSGRTQARTRTGQLSSRQTVCQRSPVPHPGGGAPIARHRLGYLPLPHSPHCSPALGLWFAGYLHAEAGRVVSPLRDYVALSPIPHQAPCQRPPSPGH